MSVYLRTDVDEECMFGASHWTDVDEECVCVCVCLYLTRSTLFPQCSAPTRTVIKTRYKTHTWRVAICNHTIKDKMLPFWKRTPLEQWVLLKKRVSSLEKTTPPVTAWASVYKTPSERCSAGALSAVCVNIFYFFYFLLLIFNLNLNSKLKIRSSVFLRENWMYVGTFFLMKLSCFILRQPVSFFLLFFSFSFVFVFFFFSSSLSFSYSSSSSLSSSSSSSSSFSLSPG